MLFKSVSDLTNLVKTKDLPKRLRRAWKSCKTYHVIFYIVPACSHFLLYINIKTHFRLNSRIACDILYSNLFFANTYYWTPPKIKILCLMNSSSKLLQKLSYMKNQPQSCTELFHWAQTQILEGVTAHTNIYSVQQHHIYLLGW